MRTGGLVLARGIPIPAAQAAPSAANALAKFRDPLPLLAGPRFGVIPGVPSNQARVDSSATLGLKTAVSRSASRRPIASGIAPTRKPATVVNRARSAPCSSSTT